MSLDPSTREAIVAVRTAWLSVRDRLEAAALVPTDVGAYCILASSAGTALLRERYGLDVSAVGCDLASKSAEGIFETEVEHPENGASAIGFSDEHGRDVYFGHVVAVVNDSTGDFLVDLELGVVAKVNPSGHIFATTADGVEVLLSMRPDHQEFATTEAWNAGPAVADLVAAAIDAGFGDNV